MSLSRAERARLRAIFGDPLPETTTDEHDGVGIADELKGGAAQQEAWLKAQVPPHHGS